MGCGGSKDTTDKGKYVANGNTKESNDKGFKKRLRMKLQAATAGKDIDVLEKAMERFQRHKLEDCGDYSKAEDRLEFLTLRRDLRDGIRRSHVGVLEKTIKDAEKSQFAGRLEKQIQAARKKLEHLKELKTYRHEILNMEQSTISEIHSYQRPPACVHDVMASTYMLLGHPEPRLTEWSDIQTLMCRVGKDSLMNGVKKFDTADVDQQTTERVQDILQQHDLDTVRNASNGAAAFYVWSNQICEKAERDRKEEEERLRQEELERQKREEREAKNPKNKSRKPK